MTMAEWGLLLLFLLFFVACFLCIKAACEFVEDAVEFAEDMASYRNDCSNVPLYVSMVIILFISQIFFLNCLNATEIYPFLSFQHQL